MLKGTKLLTERLRRSVAVRGFWDSSVSDSVTNNVNLDYVDNSGFAPICLSSSSSFLTESVSETSLIVCWDDACNKHIDNTSTEIEKNVRAAAIEELIGNVDMRRLKGLLGFWDTVE